MIGRSTSEPLTCQHCGTFKRPHREDPRPAGLGLVISVQECPLPIRRIQPANCANNCRQAAISTPLSSHCCSRCQQVVPLGKRGHVALSMPVYPTVVQPKAAMADNQRALYDVSGRALPSVDSAVLHNSYRLAPSPIVTTSAPESKTQPSTS